MDLKLQASNSDDIKGKSPIGDLGAKGRTGLRCQTPDTLMPDSRCGIVIHLA